MPAAFTALKDKRVDGFLADEVLLWAYAQKSGSPQDYVLIPDYDLPRTAGFGIKKDEPRFMAVRRPHAARPRKVRRGGERSSTRGSRR